MGRVENPIVKHPAFKCWDCMIQRCYNSNVPTFKYYGGRGITVCKRWRASFTAFAVDMGPRPPKAELDRINNNKGYTPKNVRWATRKEQCRNTRWNKMITWRGKRQPIAAWAEDLNMSQKTLNHRLGRLGWSVKDAMTIPVRKRMVYNGTL